MPSTPEFVAWTLSQACLLREDSDITDPEQTERQLRVLRSYADAMFEARCFEGICVDSLWERGFRATDVLDAYGGEELVAQQCHDCAANTLASRAVGGLAGCFGWLVLDDELTAALGAGYQRLWIEPKPGRELLQAHWQRFSELATGAPAIKEYLAALDHALRFDLPLHWRMYPAGFTDGHTWRIGAHCPRCRAPMTQHRGRCRVCDFEGASEPERRRKARGQRPYTPLAKFLGPTGAAEFIQRYQASRGEVQ